MIGLCNKLNDLLLYKAWMKKFMHYIPSNMEADIGIIRPVLLNWDIQAFRLKRKLGGSWATNWLIEAPRGEYVLRRVRDCPQTLDHQILVMRHLLASDFPYEVPRVIKPSSTSDYVCDTDARWILYTYLDGVEAPEPDEWSRARSVGALVAHYNRAVESLDLGELTGRFCLPLFEFDHIKHVLVKDAQWIRSHRARSELGIVLMENQEGLVRLFQIATSRINQINRLKNYQSTMIGIDII